MESQTPASSSAAGTGGAMPVSDLDELRAEVARLKMELEILKETVAMLTAPPERPPAS
jgi:hypothetical protein